MGCAGNREIRPPNLDRLAKEGTRFESFFCTSPVCSPARASIVTGRIPSQRGVHDDLYSNCPADETPALKGQPTHVDDRPVGSGTYRVSNDLCLQVALRAILSEKPGATYHQQREDDV